MQPSSVWSRHCRIGWAALGALLALASACKESNPSNQQQGPQPSASASAKPPATITLNATQKQDLKALLGSLRGERFPMEAIRKPKHAPLFLYLADTEKRADVVLAALQALTIAYTSVPNHKTRVQAEEDYARVVAARLSSQDPKILERAIEASSHAVSGQKPSREVIDALVKIASSHDDAAIRAEAIDRLRLIRGFWDDPRVAAALLKALHHREPFVISRALFGLRPRAAQLPDKEKFLERGLELLEHPDPGVRGRAAEFVGRLAMGKDELAEKLEPMLKDENPYVRSAAATGLSYLGTPSSIHAIAKLLGDKAENKYELCCYRTPMGRSVKVQHDGSAWGQVRDAAVHALERLSRRTELPFKADPVDRADIEGSVKKNAAAARAWYQKVRAKVPKKVEKKPPEAAAPTPHVPTPAASAGGQ